MSGVPRRCTPGTISVGGSAISAADATGIGRAVPGQPVGRLGRRRGGRSSAGRAPGCGPGGRGFKSRRSPSRLLACPAILGLVSKQNVEVVRRAWEAFVRREDETAYALYDPEVAIKSWVDGRVYHGLEGVRDFFGDWLSAWRRWDSDLEELIDAGDDVIA